MDYRKVIRDFGEDFTTEWIEFDDGAIGCIIRAVRKPLVVGWSLCTPQDLFDLTKGEAIALMRAKSFEIGWDKMFRNIPDKYYKRMVLQLHDVPLI